MRALPAGLILILGLVLAAPADAKDLFKHGPVTCKSVSPDVTALIVNTCNWKKKEGGGFYTGACDGRAEIKGEDVAFVVSGQAKRIDHVFPDNDARLEFEYRGLSCGVESPRLKTVRNCKPLKAGIGKECQVCAVTGAKVCFNVRFEVAVKSAADAGVLTEDTIGALAPAQ